MFFFSFLLFQNSLTIANDPGTSDDSGRASERLTTSSVAPRDADSSRDRLSDVSSAFWSIFTMTRNAHAWEAPPDANRFNLAF